MTTKRTGRERMLFLVRFIINCYGKREEKLPFFFFLFIFNYFPTFYNFRSRSCPGGEISSADVTVKSHDGAFQI